MSLQTFPQRLKPRCRQTTCGMAKAVSLTKPDLIRTSSKETPIEAAEKRSFPRGDSSSLREPQPWRNC